MFVFSNGKWSKITNISIIIRNISGRNALIDEDSFESEGIYLFVESICHSNLSSKTVNSSGRWYSLKASTNGSSFLTARISRQSFFDLSTRIKTISLCSLWPVHRNLVQQKEAKKTRCHHRGYLYNYKHREKFCQKVLLFFLLWWNITKD